MSAVPRPARNPDWFSWRRHCSGLTVRCDVWEPHVNVSVFPVVVRSEIPVMDGFHFCRGGSWWHLWASDVLPPHPTRDRRAVIFRSSASPPACRLDLNSDTSILGFSRSDLSDYLLEFFLAGTGWYVEFSVCLDFWQTGCRFGVDLMFR